MKAFKTVGGLMGLTVAAVVIGHFGLRYMFIGRFTLPTDADFEAIASTGRPIMQAVEDYRDDHGLLPLTLSDLVPRYLPKPTASGWWLYGNGIRHHAGVPRSEVIYNFEDPKGWYVMGEDIKYHMLNLPGPVLKRPALTGEALFRAQLAEYERRIHHAPYEDAFYERVKGFYQDKIDFLGLAHRPDLLRMECERDIKVYPHWWLPEMALAESEPLDTNAENGFVAWVSRHGTFMNYWYLARYYRDQGRTAAALAALADAAKSPSPFDMYPDASWGGMAFAFDAARFGYDHGEYDLTLKLGRHCEPSPGEWGGCTLLEYEAASELKLGEFDAAITNARHVVEIARGQPMDVEIDPRNLTRLWTAAKAHDTNFFYRAGDAAGGEWRLFVKPSP